MTLKHDILPKCTNYHSPEHDGAEILILFLKKKFFFVTTKKTQISDVLSIKNGGSYNYLLVVMGTYGQCAFMQEKS